VNSTIENRKSKISRLPLKLAILVIVIFGSVIAACLLLIPAKIEHEEHNPSPKTRQERIVDLLTPANNNRGLRIAESGCKKNEVEFLAGYFGIPCLLIGGTIGWFLSKGIARKIHNIDSKKHAIIISIATILVGGSTIVIFELLFFYEFYKSLIILTSLFVYAISSVWFTALFWFFTSAEKPACLSIHFGVGILTSFIHTTCLLLVSVFAYFIGTFLFEF